MFQRLVCTSVSIALFSTQALACAEDAMLVFDGSASMSEVTFDIKDNTRIEDARIAIRRAMPDITPYRNVGLITYGPDGIDSCSGINLHFQPMPDAADAVTAAVDALQPNGLTPLTASVERAAEILNFRTDPATVVLVTDGSETCGGAPCTLGTHLSSMATDIKIHVIGFKVVGDFFSWNSPDVKSYTEGKTVAKCLSDQTGGLFVSTETVDELVDALRQTLGCALIG